MVDTLVDGNRNDKINLMKALFFLECQFHSLSDKGCLYSRKFLKVQLVATKSQN